MLTNAPRGTNDILPDKVGAWNYVEGKIRSLCARYGYEEIRTPMFEHHGAGTLPDGRPTMQGYLDVLAKSDFGYVPLMTKRPGGEVPVPKINGVIRIDGWDWILGTGVFLDDVDRVFWQRAGQFLLIGVAVLALVVGLAAWLARGIYRTLGGEPAYAAEVASRIASGNLSQPIHTERDDSLKRQ